MISPLARASTMSARCRPRERHAHGVEFHASETYARRRRPWNGLSQDEARGTIKSVLDVLANAYDTARAFAGVVHKPSFPNRDPMEIAFEDRCSRFDRYLKRLRANGDKQ